jgi:hypothetical protein
MDGVLVNFNKAFAPAFGLDYPSLGVMDHSWLLSNSNVTLPHFFDLLACNSHLWESAEPYPWTAKLIQLLDLKVPDWMILTAATHDPDCWSGKAKWITRYFTESVLKRTVIVGGNIKARLASRGDILIDDRFENVESWIAAGGVGVQWVDYGEDLKVLAETQISNLGHLIDQHLGNVTMGLHLTRGVKSLVS